MTVTYSLPAVHQHGGKYFLYNTASRSRGTLLLIHTIATSVIYASVVRECASLRLSYSAETTKPCSDEAGTRNMA